MDYTHYGIPCKPLPTPDAPWVGEKFFDTPTEIDGPVLISGSNLSGFEYGPAALNPYKQFKHIKPTAVIQNGLFVFDGHFAIPKAAAVGHIQKARDLLASKQVPEALLQAQEAVSLAPNSVNANVALGDVLSAMGRNDDAQKAYQKALMLAQTVEPEFQVGRVGTIQEKLAIK